MFVSVLLHFPVLSPMWSLCSSRESAFTEVEHHVLSDTIPFSIRLVRRTISSLIQALERTNVRARSFWHILQRFGNSQYAIIHSFFDTMSMYIDMKIILPENCSNSHCISVIMFWISRRISNVVNPGNFFTRTPSAPRRFDPILDIGMNSWTNRFSPSMRLRDYHWFCPCTLLSWIIFKYTTSEHNSTLVFFDVMVLTSEFLRRQMFIFQAECIVLPSFQASSITSFLFLTLVFCHAFVF